MDDVKRALRGDHEAEKRLTEAGVLIPCPRCGGPAEVYEYPREDWEQPYTAKCKKNDCFWIGKDFPTRKQAIREWNTRAPILSSREWDLTESIDLALTALRPVSREQVEKVWPGCHKCRTCDSCAYRTIKPEEEPCFSCNTDIYSNYKPEPGRMFCSTCGTPMTDEAVDMVMERLEALHGEKESD